MPDPRARYPSPTLAGTLGWRRHRVPRRPRNDSLSSVTVTDGRDRAATPANASSTAPAPSATILLDVRLSPPAIGPGSVPRTALVRRIAIDGRGPLVAIEAPGGYGKSTVLAQWADRDPR